MRNIGLALVFTLVFVGCKEKAKSADPNLYVAETRAVISIDRGNTYTENLKDIEVGQEFYLQFIVIIKTTEEQTKNGGEMNLIPFRITIPATDIFDCTLMDSSGNVTQTPATDSINNVKRYDFTAGASNEPKKFTVRFRCKARDEGDCRIDVTFGEQVSSIYSKTMTMVYHNPDV